MIFTKWCRTDFWTHGCFLLWAPVGAFAWPSLCLWCSLHCPNYRPQAPRARHAACSLGYTQEPSTHKTKSPVHYHCDATIIRYITLRFWAEPGGREWEYSCQIGYHFSWIIEITRFYTAWLSSDSALRCDAKEVIIIIIIIISSSSSSSNSSSSSSSNSSSSRQVNKTWGGGGGAWKVIPHGLISHMPISKKGVKTSCNQQKS